MTPNLPKADPRIKAKILLDSSHPFNASRLTTMKITYPRIIMAEVNTHRLLCLSADSELTFDLPSAQKNSAYRPHRMTIREFYRKWHKGSLPHRRPRWNDCDLSKINPDKYYYPEEFCEILGFESTTNFNRLARDGNVLAFKEKDSRRWQIHGGSFIEYRNSRKERVYNLQSRLKEMKIRQINESTQEIQHSTINNVTYSGVKRVFKLTAGKLSIKASADHLILTDSGWLKLSEITPGIHSIFSFGRKENDPVDPKRFKFIDGKWTSIWNAKIKPEVIKKQNGQCANCSTIINEFLCDIHHIISISQDQSLAFDIDNVEALCESCHHEKHKTQGWQIGTKLTSIKILVDDIEDAGIAFTYDLEIDGEFPNFFANEIVVHNSKSSASSRAIPYEKIRDQVLNDPFIPVQFGQNQRGMKALQEIAPEHMEFARAGWESAAIKAVQMADALHALKVHKQIVNRLLEPFTYVTTIITGTEWENLFSLRAHEDAQPEFQVLAYRMMEAYLLSEPVVPPFADGETWHVPFRYHPDLKGVENNYSSDDQLLIAIARCARISYNTFFGTASPDEDIILAKLLKDNGHMAPFEHVAQAEDTRNMIGNFQGWRQYRKMMLGESRTMNREHMLERLANKPEWI